MRNLIFLLSASAFLTACQSAGTADAPAEAMEVQTPVSVTGISRDTMTESIELNATSAYLQVNTIKALTSGYLTAVNLRPGQRVGAGMIAFVMKTKEAQALGNTINALDTSFRFSGIVKIHAAVNGHVRELNHQVGDYVQDGEQLAVLTDSRSFGFILNVPYELRQYVRPGQQIGIVLPDDTNVAGTVSSVLPSVDSVSQSQQILVHVDQPGYIPQNIIGRVRLIKARKEHAQSLPWQAILSNESQTDFWVMKMIDSVTAVKIPVTKGLEINGRVEIVSPVFSPGDKIIITGNYGLADTARVKVTEVAQ